MKQTYSPEFKLKVVRFYHEHHIGIRKVAAVFELNSLQVQAWLKLYQAEGYAGLFPKPKERLPTMTKKKRQKKFKRAKKLTEVEQLRKQVAELEVQKADLELHNLILEKWLPDIRAYQPTKTGIAVQIRAERPQLPLKILLNKLHNHKTCYDNRRHRLNWPDKYVTVKDVIQSILYKESDETYSYRRMHGALLIARRLIPCAS